MPVQSKTMAVLVGPDLDRLDRAFDEMRRTKTLKLPMRPARYKGGDVLLCSTGPRGTGGLYVFVGILRGVELSAGHTHLKFQRVERFPKPVVAVYERTNYHRRDLIGKLQGWGPSDLYYVTPEAVTLVPKEAEESLSQ